MGVDVVNGRAQECGHDEEQYDALQKLKVNGDCEAKLVQGLCLLWSSATRWRRAGRFTSFPQLLGAKAASSGP